jgi:hypothetical protein
MGGGDIALRLFERTLASVKPDLRSLYVADAEHGYRLDLIDLDDFVGGLRSALRKQRDENKALRAKYSVTEDGSEALDVRQHLLKVAHVKPLSPAGALHEMIGLCPSDAVSVLTRVRHLQRL